MDNGTAGIFAWLAVVIIAVILVYFVIMYGKERSMADDDVLKRLRGSGKLSKEEYDRLRRKI